MRGIVDEKGRTPMGATGESTGVWDSKECAVLLMDYQENILGMVFEQDRRVVELNARSLAAAALNLDIPVVLSTVGVAMGLNGPTVPSFQGALPNVKAIDRSTTNAWEDPAFLAAVKATGRRRLVMGGIVTSVWSDLSRGQRPRRRLRSRVH